MRPKRVALIYSYYNRPVPMYYNRWPEQFRSNALQVKYFSSIDIESKRDIKSPSFYLEGKISKFRRFTNYFLDNPSIAINFFLTETGNGFCNNLKYFLNYPQLISFKPDIVHFVNSVTFQKIDQIWNTASPNKIVSFRGFDILVNPHIDENWNSKLKKIFQKADYLHFVSKHIMDAALLLGAPKEKCRVIYAGVDIHKYKIFRKKDYSINNNITLLTIGGLRWQKGYEYILPAIKKLLENGYKITYKIIGDGEEKEKLKLFTNKLNITEHVQFLGQLSQDDVITQLMDANIYIQPSITDAMPGSIREACAMQLPVVATNVDGIPEVIENNVNGLLVNPFDSSALFNAITTLIESPELSQKMGIAGRHIIETKFNLKIETDKWQELYLSL